MKYSATSEVMVTFAVNVEADSEEEAREIALNLLSQGACNMSWTRPVDCDICEEDEE